MIDFEILLGMCIADHGDLKRICDRLNSNEILSLQKRREMAKQLGYIIERIKPLPTGSVNP